MANRVRKLLRTFTGGQKTRLAPHLLDSVDNASGVVCQNVDFTSGTLRSAKGLRRIGNATNKAVVWFKGHFSYHPEGTIFTDLLNMKVALYPNKQLWHTTDGINWKLLQPFGIPAGTKLEVQVEDRVYKKHKTNEIFVAYKDWPLNPQAEGLPARVNTADAVGTARLVKVEQEVESKIVAFKLESPTGNWVRASFRGYEEMKKDVEGFATWVNDYGNLGSFMTPTGIEGYPALLYTAAALEPSRRYWVGSMFCELYATPYFENTEKPSEQIKGKVVERYDLCGLRLRGYCTIPVFTTKDDLLTKISTNPASAAELIDAALYGLDMIIEVTRGSEVIFKEKCNYNTHLRWIKVRVDELGIEVNVYPDTKGKVIELLRVLPAKGKVTKQLAFLNTHPGALYGVQIDEWSRRVSQPPNIVSVDEYQSSWFYTMGDSKLLDYRASIVTTMGSALSMSSSWACRNGSDTTIPEPASPQLGEELYRRLAADIYDIKASGINSYTNRETRANGLKRGVAFGFVEAFKEVDVAVETLKPVGLSGTYRYVATVYLEDMDFETPPTEMSDPVKVGGVVGGDTQLIKQYGSVNVTIPSALKLPGATHIRLYRIGGAHTKFRLVKEFSSSDVPNTFTDSIPDKNLGYELATKDNVGVDNFTYVTNYYGQLFGASDNIVRWSTENRPEYWEASSYMTFDGQIVGLAAVPGGVLVFTTIRTYIIMGQGKGMYKQLLSEAIGCVAKGSIAASGPHAIWQSHQGLVMYQSGSISQITYNTIAGELPNIKCAFFALGKYIGLTTDNRIIMVDGNYGLAISWYMMQPLSSGTTVAHEELYTDGNGLYQRDGAMLPMHWHSQKLNNTLSAIKNYKTLKIYCGNSTTSLEVEVKANGDTINRIRLQPGLNDLKLNQQGRLGYFLELVFTGIGEVLEVQFTEEDNQDDQ